MDEMRERASHPGALLDSVFAGGGELSRIMRQHDWSSTPLGPVETWTQSLRSAISICLGSRFPIVLYWGPDLVTLYNDGYGSILAEKHPWALGRPCVDVWAEIWDVIGPMLQDVVRTGEATWSEDQLLVLHRHGYPEECYFSFSFSPVRGESGGVDGIFTAVIENSDRVIGERRLQTLRDLAAQTAGCQSDEEACDKAIAVLEQNDADVPFALIYLLDHDANAARLAGAVGLPSGARAGPTSLSLGEATDTASWPLARVARTRRAELVDNLKELFGDLPGGRWPESTTSALVLPIENPGQEEPAGAVVVGVSPRHALDASYRGFFDLLVGHIATAVGDARAHEAERRRAEALAELDRAKTTFFSNVSHEFRTPLTLLLGPLQDLLSAPPGALRDDHREELEIARRNALRLLKLVNSLLDFARIEAGRVEAVFEPTDLAALTANLASVFRSAIERAGLSFVVDCNPLPEAAYVDRDMWEKIVLNLLSNALKFTPGGEIGVSLGVRPECFQLSVRDTGIGIPPDEIPYIFERFRQAHSSWSRTQEGTGIGLALVQELVRLHGGTISVTSEVGRGSVFTVEIPTGTNHLPVERIGAARTRASTAVGAEPFLEEALRWNPAAPRDERPNAQLDGAIVASGASPIPMVLTETARVLVVDDNADMRSYLASLLGQRWEVDVANDGALGLEMVRQRAPDLILSDVMMPGLDGFELVKALRADSATRTIPIILLSARAGDEATIEGLEAGADDYIVKPFGARELLARVSTHLALARSYRLLDEGKQQLALLAEQAQQEARARAAERDWLRQVVDALPEGIVIADASGQIVICNAAASQMYGLPGDETFDVFENRTFEMRRLDGSRCLVDELPLFRSYRFGEVVRGQQLILHRESSGEDISLLVSSAPLRDETNQISGAVSVFQDISTIKKLERQKDEFLSSVSHDLKTPLTAIKGHTQLLHREISRTGVPRLDRLLRSLETIESTTATMTDIVGDLLDVTRLTMDRPLDLARRPTDLVELLRDLLDSREYLSRYHRVLIETTEPALVGYWDAVRMKRALGNLLDNAVKFTPAGRKIFVRIDVESRGERKEAVVVVADEGIGIPEADLPFIFDRFRRASNVEGRIEGSGLGLASVRQVVEQHGGTVSVQSVEGEGSTFTVRLPIEAP